MPSFFSPGERPTLLAAAALSADSGLPSPGVGPLVAVPLLAETFWARNS